MAVRPVIVGGFPKRNERIAKLDRLGLPDDVTDLNVSTSAHGLVPKAPGDTAQVLKGDGAWGTLTMASAGTIIVRSDVQAEVEQTTSVANIHEVALPAITIPSGMTIRSAWVTFRGLARNTYAGENKFSGGTISLKKGSGAYTAGKSVNSIFWIPQGWNIPFELTDGDFTSVIDGSGTYTAQLALLDAQADSIFVSGQWEIGVVVTT